MQEAIQKAEVLIEALGWIRRFRGRHVVIKLGGSALDQQDAVKSLLTDVIFMETVGMKPILVHGGGKAISRAMKDADIEPNFVQGRRYTDAATLDIACRVLTREVCQPLVDEIIRQGGHAKPLHFGTDNCLVGERLTLKADDGSDLDLGFVGHVADINRKLLEETCQAGIIPVIPSIAVDRSGQRLNVNADTAAAAVARLLRAEKLVFLSDVPGIYRDINDETSLMSHLDWAGCRKLIAEGVIDAGMLPKVDAALEALDAGVQKVHIVDGRMSHSVLIEVYSNTGVGTEIVRRTTESRG
ncbi:MAG: acetylglutamate kinase [Planctomycetota bacterium]|nr:acetylglutamate kinase [Planctomycetota bacterium]